jgi:HD-GYP domain-containing protein (c-di-GMP phosphodiesterase class II)
VITHLAELVEAIEADSRLRGYDLRSAGTGYVEVGFATGSTVFTWPLLWRDRGRIDPHLRRARAGYAPVVLLGTDEEFREGRADTLLDEGEVSAMPLPIGVERLVIHLHNLADLCRLRRTAADGEMLSDRYESEIDEINAIGRALSSQRNIDKLLALILEKCRYVTNADAGSVYVVEGEDEDVSRRTLRFKVSQNDSLGLDFSEFTLPVDPSSIVGRCVISREVINIPDLYKLDSPGTGNNPWGFRHNRAFDEKTSYQTRSMLAVPMIDAGNQVIGVVQLINRKRGLEHRLVTPEDFEARVRPFTARSQRLAETLASQAGISLENTLLYEDIRQLFEGFVTAAVTAIEQRDPTTSGHSQRVADLTVMLARVTEKETTGPYAGYRASHDELKQIEYAALLHDFGKVGVREHVLVKAKKLYESDREMVLQRFDYIRRDLEAEGERLKVEALLKMPRDQALRELERLDHQYGGRVRELDAFIEFVLQANEPSLLGEEGVVRLGDIAHKTYTDPRGVELPYLRTAEVEKLQIRRGSLTAPERLEIESHVTHTYNFLRQIPWGRSFKSIPEYAGSHHEKLDGTGYPRGLHAEAISAPTRMMTISDIYDALTAKDRPYKPAVPPPKALDILVDEVKRGKLDPELFRIFLDAKVWQLTIPH